MSGINVKDILKDPNFLKLKILRKAERQYYAELIFATKNNAIKSFNQQ